MSYNLIVLKTSGWTPDQLFFVLDRSTYSVLLQSGRPIQNLARFSFLGLEPQAYFTAHEQICRYIDFSQNQEKTWKGNPLTFLEQKVERLQEKKVPSGNQIPILGGAVGYFGYEALKWTEPINLRSKPGLPLADISFMFFEWGLVFDHVQDKIILFGPEQFKKRLLEISRFIQTHSPSKENITSPAGTNEIQSNFSLDQFCSVVKTTKDYISAGDIFQANLAQRYETACSASDQSIFQNLNQINPSPFSAYFKTPDFSILSSSPERLVQSNGTLVQTRPIAGTRPKTDQPNLDSVLENELIQNQKERAEHIMLVDLERNDLGKISRYGTVKANEFLTVERYSHVRHLVSNIQGQLKPDIQPIDIVKALFPGGTITGTPKVRAMEIIDELEPVKRNAYTGSLGYFSYTGEMDFNILIRTLTRVKNRLYWHAGAGIVADSIPEKEFAETEQKAKALVKALKLTKTEKQFITQ